MFPSPSSGRPSLAGGTVAKKPTPKKATNVKPAKAKATPARSKGTATTLKETLRELESLGNAGVRAQNAKGGPWGPGAGDNQFGVKHGDIRVLAKKVQADHKLAMSLWETGNIDAQYLAILLMKPKDLSAREVDRLVRSVTFGWVADWLTNYVVKRHPDKEVLRRDWMAAADRWAARAGWSLTAERVVKGPDGLDLPALLDR